MTKENFSPNIEKYFVLEFHLFSSNNFPIRCSEIISRHIKDFSLESDTTDLAVFRIPSDQAPHFPAMFSDLEKDKLELGIANFGLDVTTMDDVFLKIGELQENEEINDNEEVCMKPIMSIFTGI